MTDKIAFTWLSAKNRDILEISGQRPDDFSDATTAELDLSGTGEEDLVFGALAAYLKLLTPPGVGIMERAMTDRAAALAGELASKGGLVDYGIALRCAWLTPKGGAWLADYEKWKAET